MRNKFSRFGWLIVLAVPLGAANWEEKKKYHYLPDSKAAAKIKKTRYQKLWKILGPATTSNEIEPAVANRLAGIRGTRLDIPANAFVDAKGKVYGGKVQIKITEVIDPLDFVTAGVDLTYYPQRNKREMFKSAGMFRVDAAGSDGNPLTLAPGKKVAVEFPNVTPGDEFYVYRHDADQAWQLHGHNQSIGNEGGFRVGTRVYKIDALNTWWNFDKPVPEGACAKGAAQMADGSEIQNFAVYSVGTSYKGAFSRRIPLGNKFRVNVHKSSKARFMVFDAKGNVGISPVIDISEKTGFDQAEEGPANFCQDIGTITVAPVDETIMSDKKMLSEFLGLPVTEYDVNYQQNAPDPRARP